MTTCTEFKFPIFWDYRFLSSGYTTDTALGSSENCFSCQSQNLTPLLQIKWIIGNAIISKGLFGTLNSSKKNKKKRTNEKFDLTSMIPQVLLSKFYIIWEFVVCTRLVCTWDVVVTLTYILVQFPNEFFPPLLIP